MHFAFKRPESSKSQAHLQSRSIRDRSPLPTHNLQSPPTFQVTNPNKKWQQAAQKINKEMIYQRVMHSSNQSLKLLTRIGGRTYNSQPKQSISEDQSKTRVRVSSKEKGSRDLLRESREFKMIEEEQSKEVKAQSKLKRKKRGDMFKGIPLEKELKITNIFYENPVVKIGFNMQFQAQLKIEHISQIKPENITSVCRNSIIFFLKDAPFNPNIISEKNTEVPISLSLFPEFFDSKLSVSHTKRQQYLQKMFAVMNNTYDPERMAKIAPFSEYPPFKEEEYFETARKLVNFSQEDYPPCLLQGILKLLKISINPFSFKVFVNEQWELWSLANAMSNLDYILKDPKAATKFKLVPYLQTRVSTSKKILYHGGYCKGIYESWNKYVQSGKKKLNSKLTKYNSVIQVIHGWYGEFEDIILYEPHLIGLLGRSISINLFHSLQMIKIRHSIDALETLWFRGTLCLLHYGRFLEKHKREYWTLVNYKPLLIQYVEEAEKRVSELKTAEEQNNFFESSYENFISSLRRESNIYSLDELLPCKQIFQVESCDVSNVEVLLNIQLARTIENSFRAFQEQIMEPGDCALIRLNLIIDRQTIKFMEQEEEIVNSFLEIISAILNTKIEGFNLKCIFQAPKTSQKTSDLAQVVKQSTSSVQPTISVKEYPQIVNVPSPNSEQDRKLSLYYKTGFIFDKEIREIIERVREYYRDCYGILNQFQSYLPFIKLTTTQKLFGDEEGHAEQSFLKNLKIIARYKQSIKSLQKRVTINLFEVDCSIPIRILQERIDEIEYIIEQNYINIIHERIEDMDSQLNSIKIDLYNVGTGLGSKESQDKLNAIKTRMEGLQGKSKIIAEMVLFCLDNKRKIETIVTCYCQLALKKQELQKELQRLFVNFQIRRPEYEAEQEALLAETFVGIDKTIKTLSQNEATPFELSNLPEYLALLKGIQERLETLEAEINRCEQWARNSISSSLQDKIEVFHREKARFALAQQFWVEFYRFASFYKQIAKIQARKVKFTQFSERVEAGEMITQKVIDTQSSWREGEKKIKWKPIIHSTHEYYYNKFQTDLGVFRQIQPYLQILTNHKIKEKHWSMYGVEEFKTMTCRQLSKLQKGYKWRELSTMNSQVNFEYQIFLSFQDIEKQIRGHCLLIIDLNGSDILDINNIKECLQFLHNIQIQIQKLKSRDVNGYYAGELVELKQIAVITRKKLKQWLIIQQKYIKYLRYHIANEEYESSLFQNLLQLHRKLVKSYDIDNSILFISKNIVMDTYLSQIKEELEELDNRMHSSLGEVRLIYPRLHLLSNQELFSFMSSGADVEYFLKRLFPQIVKFHVNDGTVQKVGLKKELPLTEPLYFQEIAGRVSSWVAKLEEDIKLKMKEFYKTGILLSEDKSDNDPQNDFLEKRPLQLALLEECLKFTEAAAEKGLIGKMKEVIVGLNEQIEYITKETKEVNRILMLMLLRFWAEKLQQTQPGCFDWQKIPQFIRKGSMLQPKVVILGHEYSYGFNYLQQCSIIFTDTVFIGNCLVGEGEIGKGSIMRHYSYLCGQELLQFNPLSLFVQEDPTSQLLSYFRVTVATGAWLFVRRMDRLIEEQLSLISQCIISISTGLKEQLQKVTINGLQFNLNKNVRIFMSVESLSNSELPARLVNQVRPIWIAPPDRSMLLSIYLQTKCLNNVQTGKIVSFLGWIDDHDELKLEVLTWIKREENPDMFIGSNFLRALTEQTVFKSAECQMLLQYLKRQESSLSGGEALREIINLSQQISRRSVVAIYGPPGCGKTKEIMKIIGPNYMFLNNETCLSDEEFFKQIRGFQQISKQNKEDRYLILKNSLAYWPLIKLHLTRYKVIMVEQDLTQLHMGLLHHFRVVDFNQYLKQSVKTKNPCAVQLMLPHIVPIKERQLDIFELIDTPHSAPIKILIKLEMVVSEHFFYGISTHQIAIHFLQILRAMINEGYDQTVSFIFAVIWTYGFSIQEKRLEEILKDISMPDVQTGKTKFAKISQQITGKMLSKKRLEENLLQVLRQALIGKIGPLAQLIPSKNGKLVLGSDFQDTIGALTECELFSDLKVNFKSSFIYNLRIIRNIYPGTITVDSKDWLTTFLKSSSSSSRYCNFGRKTPYIIFQELFKNTSKTGSTYHLSNPHIIVDDLHLSHELSFGKLQDFFEYGFVSLEHHGKLSIFKTERVIWTLGTKHGFPLYKKHLTIRAGDLLLTTIFNDYIQSYCEEHLQVDRSVFCLLNLSGNINRFYKDLKEDRYFWFKNPLILIQKVKFQTLTELIESYFDHLIEILPEENVSLQVQRNMLQLRPKTNRPEQQSQSQDNTINTVSKLNRFLSENSLIEELLLDNQILEQIQAKEIEPIYFDKFVKNYFPKELLNYTKRIHKHLLSYNIVVLYNRGHPAHRIVRYAVKLSKCELVAYSEKDKKIGKEKMVLVELDQIDDASIENLQEIVKSSQTYLSNRLIIMAEIDSQSTKKYFVKYPFLKSHFLNIVIPPFASPINQPSNTGVVSNIVEDNWENNRYLQKLQDLIAQEGLDSSFREEFLKEFEGMRKKELNNFQFYRKITSEMVISIDKISKALAETPSFISNLRTKQTTIKVSRRRATDDIKQIKTKMEHWQKHFQKSFDLIRFKEDEEMTSIQRLIQNAQPVHAKMQKLEKKIENQQTVEFARLKNNLKNNENANIVQNLHQVLGFLQEKTQNFVLKDKGAAVMSALVSPHMLSSFLKGIRRRENYEIAGEDGQKIVTSMTKGRIHHFLGKVEEIEGNLKKYEKVSLIYKSVVSWISLFGTLNTHLSEYLQKQEEISIKILTDLAELVQPETSQEILQKMSKELPLINEQAKRNLIECQEKQHVVNSMISEEEKEQKKLQQLEYFYDQRLQRLQRISEALARSEYMKKVSSGVSLYFKHLEQIVFSRTQFRVSLTEFDTGEVADLEFLRGIYTFREDLYHLRQKTGASGPLKELEVLVALVQEPTKSVSLVQDKEGLFKSKLVDLAQKKDYMIKSFTHSNYDSIQSWAQLKLLEHDSLLIVHENINYLQSQKEGNEVGFNRFIDKLIKLAASHHQRKILYITNYLPRIRGQLYSRVTIGRLRVGRQRLFNDVCDAFEIMYTKETQAKTKKQRTDIQTIIKQRNSKTKELLSNIQSLSTCLQSQNWLDVLSSNSDMQKNYCEVLENNLVNLQMLEYELQSVEKGSYNMYYLPWTYWNQVEKELDRYYLLYKFTDFTNNHTNNQLSSNQELYVEWNSILRRFREEKVSLFTRSDYRPIINEITIKGEGDENHRKDMPSNSYTARKEEDLKLFDLILNPNFRKHNTEIFNLLAEKIISSAAWVERSSLVRYTLGIAAIISLLRCGFNWKEVFNFLIKHQDIKAEEIGELCQTVLKKNSSSEYSLTSFKGEYLVSELYRLVNSGENALHLESAIFLGLYYNLAIDPHLANQPTFIQFFKETLDQKGTFSYRYSPLRLAYLVKLTGETALKLTEPLSLSLNFEGRPGERQRLITIIEEQRYLVNELVDVLRVKALSRKRELVIFLVNMKKKQETLDKLKLLYGGATKCWVYLANLTIHNNWKQFGQFLQQIIQELQILPNNPYFRIFLICPCQNQGQHFFYNKFQVSRFKSNHFISDNDYYNTINAMYIQKLTKDGNKKSKQKTGSRETGQNLGILLIEQLILSTINQEEAIVHSKLSGLLLFFKKISKKFHIFLEQDHRILYRNIVEELANLGYLQQESDDNFCQYLADYFSTIDNLTAKVVKENIEAEHQLCKQGLFSTIILNRQELIQKQEISSTTLEKINLPKIQEYFKNINSEFGDMLRREIMINNRLISQQIAVKDIERLSFVPKTIAGQHLRNYQMKFGVEMTKSQPTPRAIREKLPLIKFLTNIKLKEICTTKRVELTNPSEFYNFLSAYEFRLVRDYMQRQISPDDIRYSSVQFGNYIHTRDYLSKMRVYLVDEETYQEIPLVEEQITQLMETQDRVEARFVVGIRKIQNMKMNELNNENQEIGKILQNYTCVLMFETELVIELSLK